MKKSLILLAILLSGIYVQAQEDNTFRLGVQFGMQGNRSRFSAGMEEANARFHQNRFGAAGLNIAARYDFNKHWAVVSGIGLTSVGFEFGIAENYSFLQHGNRFTMLNAGFSAVEIPIMGMYKFNPNCKGWRWIVSAGVANLHTGNNTKTTQTSNSSDGTPLPANSYLSSQEYTNAGNHLQARFMIGREKVFQRGSILSVSLLYNRGFSEVAHATVSYNIDGQFYSHEFSNNGNFAGFRVAYYFKPFSGGKKLQAKPVSKS